MRSLDGHYATRAEIFYLLSDILSESIDNMLSCLLILVHIQQQQTPHFHNQGIFASPFLEGVSTTVLGLGDKINVDQTLVTLSCCTHFFVTTIPGQGSSKQEIIGQATVFHTQIVLLLKMIILKFTKYF